MSSPTPRPRLLVACLTALAAAAVAAPFALVDGDPVGGAAHASATATVAASGTTTPTEPTPTEPTPTEPTPTQPPPTEPPPPVPTSPTMRIVQANLKAGLSVRKFQKDVAEVFAQQPDFVTYNEVSGRQDAVLAPPGYDIQRTPGYYTAASPVVWNTARWTELASGTERISNKYGRMRGQKRHWGVRYANWVTLQSTTGEVVSVVATHLAPDTKVTRNLLKPSLRRLGRLASVLGTRGPVLLGGDLNVNYRSVQTYPRSLMERKNLTPTYDLLGPLATGDHRGATIDYVLMHLASQFVVQGHYTEELRSDHDLLAADVALVGSTASTFAPGTIVNSSSRNAVVRTVGRVLDKAPEGSSVHLATRRLGGKGLVRALLNAHRRGVHVQVLTNNRRATKVDRKLARQLGSKVRRKSWAINRANGWRRAGLPDASVLASISGGTPALRVDVNRPLVPASQRRRMTARIATTKPAYDDMFVRFFRAAGRRI